MRDLDRALGDIGSIRRQMARSVEFRGYGPATLACTGAFALVGAWVQAVRVPEPQEHIRAYLGIWFVTAVLSAAVIAVQTVTRSRRMHSGMADEMIRMAVEQFLPAAAAGALITPVIVRCAFSSVWMLPGLWQIIFGLGVFSSCRFLPRPMLIAGVWYLCTGLACIALTDERALSPWTMGIPYGVGQVLVAGVLFFNTKGDSDED